MSTLCPTFLSSGSCNNRECAFFSCDMCRRAFGSSDAYKNHCASKSHQRRVSSATIRITELVFCSPCRRFLRPAAWHSHKRGKAHQMKATALNISPDAQPTKEIPPDINLTHRFCSHCQVYIGLEMWGKHVNKAEHLRGARYVAFKMAQGEAEKDKNDVEIQGDLDFSIVDLETSRQSLTRTLELRITTPLAKVSLLSVKLCANLGSARKKRVPS
jgi:helicase MOV-10